MSAPRPATLTDLPALVALEDDEKREAMLKVALDKVDRAL